MEAKVYGLEMSLRRAQENAEVARDHFATVSQRVLREVDRFKRETTEDMRLTVLEYIRMQVEYNKKMEQIWAALIPQLERVSLDNNANVVGDLASNAGLGSTNGTSVSNTSTVMNTTQAMQRQVQTSSGSQINSHNVINNSISNPQQAYVQTMVPTATIPNNQFLSQNNYPGAAPTQPPQQNIGSHQDPAMLSVQCR